MNIIVIGDTCIDINYYGEVKRISPEAPVPIFNILSKERIPGMSYNVVKNLEQAGNKVTLYDKDISNSPNKNYKHRYFSGKHYLYRIDEENLENLREESKTSILYWLNKKISTTDAVILQDYNKGMLDKEFVTKIINLVSDTTLIIADGNKERRSDFYFGVDYLKLNQQEYEALSPDINSVQKGILLTKGENGAELISKEKTLFHPKVTEKVIDVTGAGDTFTAWFTHELLKTKDEERALKIASIAAGISVKHLGCYAPTPEEVYSKI